MKHTYASMRQSKSVARQNTSANAVAVSPPAYGIDFLDSQRTQSRNDPVQRIHLNSSSEGAKSTSTKPENKTGMPSQLKSGIESLSGVDVSDVRVHYNSSKPAQLNAHAYTQGTDIHIASGQERHLPHEAWHAVQQKQGRVQPTMQMKGGVNINDDSGLEKEADVMGAKALTFNATTSTRKNSSVASCPTLLKNSSDNGAPNSTGNIELILQRAISKSATFKPGNVAMLKIEELDKKIPEAEQAASDFVRNIELPPNYIHTPSQAAYMANPNPALWGMCVEEQLNPLAENLGWTTQKRLPGSRPDFYLQINDFVVYVDLTTTEQASVGGFHSTLR